MGGHRVSHAGEDFQPGIKSMTGQRFIKSVCPAGAGGAVIVTDNDQVRHMFGAGAGQKLIDTVSGSGGDSGSPEECILFLLYPKNIILDREG